MEIKCLFLFIIIFFSYSCKRTESTLTQVDITNGIEKDINLNLSSVANEIRAIPLETNKECIIGSIHQIMIKDTFIFVTDTYDNLFIYNKNGRLISKISNKGNGPEEYLNILNFDVSINDKLIYFLDGIKSKIFLFDFKGNFVKYIDLGTAYTSRICLLNDSTLALYYDKHSLPNSNYYRILLYNKKFRQIGRLQKVKKESIDYLRQPSTWSKMYVSNSKMYFWETVNDTVYFVENNIVIPYFVFKTDEYHLPNNNLISNNKSLKWKGKYVEISNFFETPNYLFITARFDVYRKCIIYNKKDALNFNVVFNFDIYDNGFHNDLDGGIPFWPKGQTDKGELFDYMNPYDLKELILKPYFKTIKIMDKTKHEQLLKLLDESKFEDNPIIFIIN